MLWENHLAGPFPVVVTVAPEYAVDGVPAQCLPGRSGGSPDAAAAALSGYSVVHLHGGMTYAPSDGWTENIAAPGQPVLDVYPNEQRAAMLWYHDHVMGVTRFDVYAGLAGLWIVRDERERELELPEGPPYEVPLLLADRNFDVDDDGSLTGDLLHKTDPEVMECFSPFTTVNGTVWPHLDVDPTTYRFRLLNGSNARTYRLVLTRDGQPDHGRITQIGSEGGLFQAPVSIPEQGLVLASAERADLLVDFSDLALGSRAHPLEHRHRSVRRQRRRPREGGARRPRRPAALPGSATHPRRRGAPRRTPRPAGARDRLPADESRRADRSASSVRSRSSSRRPEIEDAPPMLTMRELALDPSADEPVTHARRTATGR